MTLSDGCYYFLSDLAMANHTVVWDSDFEDLRSQGDVEMKHKFDRIGELDREVGFHGDSIDIGKKEYDTIDESNGD